MRREEPKNPPGEKGKEMKNGKAPEIFFYAAECMEFINYRACIEVPDLAQAVAAYRRICRRGGSCGPGIGFVLQDSRIPDYSDVHWPLYQCGRIAQDDIDLIPAYRDHPLVKQAVKELEQYLPKLSKPAKAKRSRER